MGHYVNLTLQEANKILALYSFEPIKDLNPLSLGISNSNYQVTLSNQTQLLLKVSNDKNIDQLISEQEVISYLKTCSFPYSIAPYPTLKGDLVYSVPPYFGVVNPFIHGQAPAINERSCFEIGRGLALLHQINLPTKRLRHYQNIGHDLTIINDFSDSPACPQDFKESFNQIFQKKALEEILSFPFPTGIIHGDLYYDNALFIDDTLITFLDFEQSGIGQFILDIGISISGTCLEKGKISQNLQHSFMKGYQLVRILSKEEESALNQFILIGLFSIALWRVERFTLGNLDPSRSLCYQELLQRALNFKQQMAN